MGTHQIIKNCKIGKNTKIWNFVNLYVGENAIVGAGSVVTKNVPKNTIVAGNPAQIIRTYT